ncbi:EfeM/EfeO family lipoprotein [Mycolicibacterium gilvum]|uniref:Predicted periplasmic lipoprotein involved in iron transport n=2 Tax=Mycolicibacterium gilvum TaxID=1804 RepID=E6TJ10_MYCSR|nr:EfeM/EfeO family lipoprotein [Mycolicibacterium gilvum]ADT98033.1 predicted periplasmic lipoprotein involved in iron transport [Mycolicibacterium gilvum Spyr1]MCV7055464.1 EfeM/EfeO family lipoprotein [Mycolicibacterium gilvum]STZ45241.1 periplasmic lipoprotein involved in iron transport [Mycolicibacterium gilvum]
MGRHLTWPAAVAAAAMILAGCGGSSSDDNATATGSSAADTTTSSAAPANPLVEKAAADYKAYATAQIDELVGAVKVFTDAVRAGDLQAAQNAYAPSRLPWERIEPLAGLVEEIDGKVDARVDDFAGADDPAFTGWHRLEYLLFEQNTTDGGAPFADQLDADIATLKEQFASVEVTPLDVATGAAELIEEVSEGKITGEEDRYSKTDLWDFDANMQGSQAAVDKLSPALVEADPALLGKIEAGMNSVFDTMRPLRRGDGWVLFCTENDPFPSPRCPEVTVDPATIDTLKAELAGLSENLAQVSGVLKLQ